MTKRSAQMQAAEYVFSRQHHPIFPPDAVEEARRVLQELWLPRLRAEMIRCHPDHGGTVTKFTAAHRRYTNAKAKLGVK
jgi:hypothetical protein